jgi:hypothetical protein
MSQIAGCNLLTQTPEIKHWLCNLQPGAHLVLGAYAYADGDLHTKLVVGMDAIQQGVLNDRPHQDTALSAVACSSPCSLAFLCSPTDIFSIPAAARAQAEKNYSAASQSLDNMWQGPLRGLSSGACGNPSPSALPLIPTCFLKS